MIDQVNKRIKHYREANKQIIYIQLCDEGLVEGSIPWAIIDELEKDSEGIYMIKRYAYSYVNNRK